MAELVKVAFRTEKGGVAPKVRSAVKEQVLDHVALTDLGFEAVEGKSGTFALPVATDELTEATVYAVVELKVTDVYPHKAKPSAKGGEDTVDVPTLF